MDSIFLVEEFDEKDYLLEKDEILSIQDNGWTWRGSPSEWEDIEEKLGWIKV